MCEITTFLDLPSDEAMQYLRELGLEQCFSYRKWYCFIYAIGSSFNIYTL